MVTFQMQHGVSLKSGKSIRAFAFYRTEDKSEIEELRSHAKNGVCTEVQNKKQEKKKDEDENHDQGQSDEAGDNQQNPAEDITTVKGVGASVEGKLAEAGITTVSQLKDAVSGDPEKIKELIGAPSLAKIQEHFGIGEQDE